MKIDFARGATRVVILFSNKAVKIGKIRVLRLITSILEAIVSKRRRKKLNEQLRKKYNSNLFYAVCEAFAAGIIANRNEFAYYQQHKDKRVMPTIRIFLFGMIIVQERGKRSTPEELEKHNPLRAIRHLLSGTDLKEARQYCFDSQGSLRLVDYGDQCTINLLQSTLP